MAGHVENREVLPLILAVDDSPMWRNGLLICMDEMHIAHEGFEDPEAAIARMNAGDVTAVITSGLRGGWKDIVIAATQSGIKPVYLYKSSSTKVEASELGAVVFAKDDFRSDFKSTYKRKALQPIIIAALLDSSS